jgi:predicted ATPase
VQPDFPDGVWLVELAPLTDPDDVPHAVNSALSVREPGPPMTSDPEALPVSPSDLLRLHLQDKRALLILDTANT